MKIAISAKGPDLTAEVDPRFGRAAYLIVVDTETMNFEAVDNAENVNAFKGAGIRAATMVCDKGAEILMTGYCGPKAFDVLKQAGIKVVAETSGTVQQAAERCKAGDIVFVTDANAEAHW